MVRLLQWRYWNSVRFRTRIEELCFIVFIALLSFSELSCRWGNVTLQSPFIHTLNWGVFEKKWLPSSIEEGENCPQLRILHPLNYNLWSMSEFISLDDAKSMTHRYQDSVPEGTTISCEVDKSQLIAMLNQEDCQGLRIYFALNEEERLTTVLVGSDSSGSDMVVGLIINRSAPCPPSCPISSPLNK